MNYKKKTKFKKILMAVMMVMSIVTVMAVSVSATSTTPEARMTSIMSIAKNLAAGLFGSEGLVITFFTWLVSDPVLPFFIIGMTVSLILLGVKIVRGVIWGT